MGTGGLCRDWGEGIKTSLIDDGDCLLGWPVRLWADGDRPKALKLSLRRGRDRTKTYSAHPLV